ncbi:unnamed protein product [Euphydryas editha]|uniref:Reverse transcriptase domain-containing protein n=1 Tax=Euphydryas editha TaxID=104508 RepID=A0AAU9UIS9_EUPED|nr:unnamed protein product [Euphydryas editha]
MPETGLPEVQREGEDTITLKSGNLLYYQEVTNSPKEVFDVNINGESITLLNFSDNNVLMAELLEDLNIMLGDLDGVSQQVGLKVNMDKTKIISNVVPILISVDNSTLEVVDLLQLVAMYRVTINQTLAPIFVTHAAITLSYCATCGKGVPCFMRNSDKELKLRFTV